MLTLAIKNKNTKIMLTLAMLRLLRVIVTVKQITLLLSRILR